MRDEEVIWSLIRYSVIVAHSYNLFSPALQYSMFHYKNEIALYLNDSRKLRQAVILSSIINKQFPGLYSPCKSKIVHRQAFYKQFFPFTSSNSQVLFDYSSKKKFPGIQKGIKAVRIENGLGACRIANKYGWTRSSVQDLVKHYSKYGNFERKHRTSV